MKQALSYALALISLTFQVTQSKLQLPHTETVKLQPGTAFGFEFLETPVPSAATADATIDCVLYNYVSDKPINAELFFRQWSSLVALVLNGTDLPQEDAAFGTLCEGETSCEVFYNGTVPAADKVDPVSGLPYVPHTVVFWYDDQHVGNTNLTYTVDAPCYGADAAVIEGEITP